MVLTFRYHAIPEITNGLRKPTIPVEFKMGESGYMTIMALVDSGSDVIVLPRGLAEIANVKLSKETSTSNGIGGKVEVKKGSISFRIKNKHEYHYITAPVEIMDDDKIPMILGRKGFFDKFIVIVDEKHKTVKLKEHPNKNRKKG